MMVIFHGFGLVILAISSISAADVTETVFKVVTLKAVPDVSGTVPMSSRVTCAANCARTKSCTSFNFKTNQKSCDVIRGVKDVSFGNVVTPVTYYNRHTEDITSTPKTTINISTSTVLSDRPRTTRKPYVPRPRIPRTTRKPYVPRPQIPRTTRKPYVPRPRIPRTTRKPYVPRQRIPRTTRKPYVPRPRIPKTTRKPYVPRQRIPRTTRKPYVPRPRIPRTTRKPYVPRPRIPRTTRKPYVPRPRIPRTTRKPYVPRQRIPRTTRKPYIPRQRILRTTRKPYVPRPRIPRTTRKPYAPRPRISRTTRKPSPPKKASEKSGRILFIGPEKKGKVEKGQIQIRDQKVTSYPYLTGIKSPRWALCAIYLSKVKFIAMGTVAPNTDPLHAIIFDKLDKKETNIVARDVHCYGLAADERLGYLFAAVRKPILGVIRLDMKRSMKIETVKEVQMFLKDIVADTASQTLYATSSMELIKLKYDGSDYKVFFKYHKKLYVALGKGVLYYTDGEKLMAMILTTYKSRKIADLPDNARSLVYSNGFLYVGFSDKRYVWEFNIKIHEIAKITIIGDESRKYHNEMILCFLPEVEEPYSNYHKRTPT